MNDAFSGAIRLLARREHGAAELLNKLVQKGHQVADIQDALAACQEKGLQSDLRFAEALTRTRVHQGYGPERIRRELLALQVAELHIENALCVERDNWMHHAKRVWEKKYKTSDDESFHAKQKQKQFLLYRGFSIETISKVIER